ELLARGSQLAWSAVALALGRWILRGFVIASSCSGYCRVAKTGWAFPLPATGNWNRNFDFSGRRCVSGTPLDSIRFWELHQPVTGTSLFHIRPIAKRRA